MPGTRPLICTALAFIAIIVGAATTISQHNPVPFRLRWKDFVMRSQDMTRYHAYANAALGKPYLAFYVRSDAAWRQAFAAGEHVPDPDKTMVTPDRPLRPYRDFLVEYPPGFFLAAIPPALATDNERTYGLLFELGMIALLVAAWVSSARVAPYLGAEVNVWLVIGWGALACTALGLYSIQRYDPVVALLVSVMCLATLARRPILLGVAAGAAVAVKLVPVVVAGLCALYLLRRGRLRELTIATVTAAIAVVAIVLPVVYGAGSSIDRVLWYHLDRPLEIESTAAAVLGLWHAVDPSAVSYTFSFGSSNVTGRLVEAASWAANITTAGAIVFVFALAWRELRRSEDPAVQARVLVGSTLLALATIVAFGKVSSPQYFTWLIPLGAMMTLVDGRGSTMAWFLVAMAAPQLLLSFATRGLVGLAPWAFAAVIARNGLLLGWAWRLRQRAWRL